MGYLLFFFQIFLFSTRGFALELTSTAFHFTEKFQEAQEGDYLVLDYQKTYTFLHVLKKDECTVDLEEISIASYYVENPFSWREWYLKGAPKNSSWLLYTVNFQNGTVSPIYSKKDNRYLENENYISFLSTLLKLELSLVPMGKRLKAGPSPGAWEDDTRPVWNPRIKIDGLYLKGGSFDVWETKWPSDGSEIANKTLQIYFSKHPLTPTYFPYWIQLVGQFGQFKLRAVDSGRALKK